MNPLFITSLIGVALAVLSLGQVSPSVSSQIAAKSVENGVTRENALIQQIIRYRGIEGAYPSTVTDLINKGYWNALNNDNGFGGTFSFTVDAPKGVVTLNSTVSDATRRSQYVSSYKHAFKHADIGGGVVSADIILPSTGSIGAPVANSGSIPVSTTAPDAATNTYWYNTSSGTAVLNVSNGAAWSPAGSTGGGGGGAAIPSGAIMYFNLSTCPSGWLAADGTSGTPDVRGQFIRSLDQGKGVDPSRTLASTQAAYAGSFTWQINTDDGDSQTGTYTSITAMIINGVTLFAPNYGRNGASGVVTTYVTPGDSRPTNIAFLTCVKQ